MDMDMDLDMDIARLQTDTATVLIRFIPIYQYIWLISLGIPGQADIHRGTSLKKHNCLNKTDKTH